MCIYAAGIMTTNKIVVIRLTDVKLRKKAMLRVLSMAFLVRKYFLPVKILWNMHFVLAFRFRLFCRNKLKLQETNHLQQAVV
jgi:hypothetical protein